MIFWVLWFILWLILSNYHHKKQEYIASYGAAIGSGILLGHIINKFFIP